MKKHIAEDLPARSHPQAQLSSQNQKSKDGSSNDKKYGGGEKTPEERIRQAVYDIRYRARREKLPLRAAYSQYMQNSSMAEQEKTEVRGKLFGDVGGASSPGMKSEDFNNYMKESASNAVSNVLYKVFVEKNDEVVDLNQLKYGLEEKVNDTSEGKKYKVRVTDRKSNVTYVRYATRQKISELREKGLDVEMTEYGTPYEGERTKGEQTSKVLGDRAKKDYDGDGKVESGAKEYRGAVHNAIQRKKGGNPDGRDTSNVRENFLGEVSRMANLPETDAPQKSIPNSGQLDLATTKNKIVVNPSDSSTSKLVAHHEMEGDVIIENGYSKFLEMLREKKMTKAEKKKEKKLKNKYDPSGMKASMKKQYGTKKGEDVYFATIRKQAMDEGAYESDDKNLKNDQDKPCMSDPRSKNTTLSLFKNRLRAMGVRNPTVLFSSEETVEEGTGLISKFAGQILANPRTSAEQGAKNFQKNVTDPVGRAAKGAVRALVLPLDMSPEAQKARKDKYRLEEVEFEGELVDESRLGDRAQSIEKDEAQKGGLRRARSNREEIAGNIRYSQNVDPQGDLGRQKAPKDTGLHKGESRSKDAEDDERPRRNRGRDDNPALTARERNPNLR